MRKERAGSISQPLLVDSLSPNEKNHIDMQNIHDESKSHQSDYLAGRIYASNAPKILLETITARTAFLIILFTYIFFILGFFLDLQTIYQSFNSNKYDITAYNCSNYNMSSLMHERSWGCASDSNHWNSSITELTNVISIKLTAQQNNLTKLLEIQNTTFTITYNVQLWACYNDHGCLNNFQTTNDYTSNPNIWQIVLTQTDQKVDVNLEYDITSNDQGTGIQKELIANTFQNQESIPTNGLVKSYHIQVTYLDDQFHLFSGDDPDTQPEILYIFDVINRPKQPIEDAITIVLLFFTICLTLFYITILMNQKKILSEQKWLIGYFILVILFQNPAYCVIVWYGNAPSPESAYTSYALGYVAQSGLFILWTLFADSVHRKSRSALTFYLPKLFIGLLIFAFAIAILTVQFPGLNPAGSNRDAVEAVVNWSHDLKIQFIAITIIYLLLIWIWTLLWFIRLYVTGRKLKRLPYMSTRYMQLSYRYFLLQATLVTVYYVFQYAIVVYYISNGTDNNDYDLTDITDNINTVFRQQTQLFGKTLFLTVYAAILAFLFLPSNFLDSNGITTSLAATYTITEAEQVVVTKFRKNVIHNMKKNILNKMTGVNQLVNAKVDVFCVDRALNLRNVAYQAYYDPPGLKTASGYEGVMDLESIGFEMVKYYYNKEHEVFCFVAREIKTKRLVVSFRGTASKKQMEHNLKYKKIPVNFSSLNIPSLDQLDGLAFRKIELDDEFDLESVSDDEEDIDENLDVESGNATNDIIKRHSMNIASDGNSELHRENSTNIIEKAGEGLTRAITGAIDVADKGINRVVGATTDLVVTAATHTPVLKNIISPQVHSGFWDAYTSVRGFIHAVLREELANHPSLVFFTGHSLGGALATLAALDFTVNSLPRINHYLKHQAKLKLKRKMQDNAFLNEVRSPSFSNYRSSSIDEATIHNMLNSDLPHTTSLPGSVEELGRSRNYSFFRRGHKEHHRFFFNKKIKAVMYNFGSPRVGNSIFAQFYDKLIPQSFRVVVDGDIVAGLPPSGYLHIGTEILIDSLGAGSIIIDPSFVERWLRTHMKSSVAVHSLLVYRKGLLGLKLSAEYMKQYAKELARESIDPLKLALQIRSNYKLEKLVNEQSNLPIALRKAHTERLDSASSIESNPISRDQILMRQMSRTETIVDEVIEPTLENKSINDNLEESEKTESQKIKDEKHYATDIVHMEEFLKQIKDLKKPGAINWLKVRTANRFKAKKTSIPKTPTK